MEESFDKTISPHYSQGEQEEYDNLDLTETPSGEYHAFSYPSTEESREGIEITPMGTPRTGGAEPSSDSIDLFSAGQYS